MSDLPSSRRAFVEPLEARIAPAGVLTANWKTATFGAPIELFAGDGLSTGGANSGTYLLYVDKGSALVFLTDLNNNGDVDFNEITGIAAGNGLRLTSFADIHGDITTNLTQLTGTISGVPTTRVALTDSDNDRTNDFFNLGDGRILANSIIESITLRSLRLADLPDQNGDGVVDDQDVAVRKAYTTYSIHGDIVAGRGFGVAGGGLLIDTTNESGVVENFGFAVPPSVGGIRVGSSASGHFFSYGSSNADDVSGTFINFFTPNGQSGGDIIGVRAAAPATRFNLDGLYAGDGGLGARGGNILDVTINADDSGGYEIIAGNGGRGSTGGAGGSILNFTDFGSQTGNVVVRSGSGGPSVTGAGGNAGAFSIGTFNVFGNITIDLGSGGNGFTAGGNGAALTRGIFNQPNATAFIPGNGLGTMHQSFYDPADAGNNDPMIGATQGIDFDGDGFGDWVFTSKTTSLLVVQMGEGDGTARRIQLPDNSTILDRVYLSGARNAEALTVGDFNGDGKPDVAAASRDRGSQAGIVVFLNKGTEDQNENGVLDSGEDRDGDNLIDFLGFTPGRYSVLPQFDRGDPDVNYTIDGATFATPGFLPYFAGPPEISSLTSGDYDGDGHTEIAAIVTLFDRKVTDPASGLTTGFTRSNQVLVYLTPDQEFNNSTGVFELTGQFFADFGTRERIENGVTVPPAPRVPFQFIFGNISGAAGNFNNVVIETSALTINANHDVVFVGVRAQNNFRVVEVYDYQNRDLVVGLTVDAALLGDYTLGRVDVNRDLSGAGQSDKKSLQDYTLRDFTVLDFDADGIADLAVLSAAPALFLVGIKGDGLGAGAPNSGSGGTIPFPNGPGGAGNNNDDNAGNFFGGKGINLMAPELMSIHTVAGDGIGGFDDLAVLDSTGDWIILDYRAGVMPTDAAVTVNPVGVRNLLRFAGTTFVPDASDEFFSGVMVPDLSLPEVQSVFTAFEGRNSVFVDPVRLTFGNFFDIHAISERGFRLEAGDGGDALVGKGGIGGLLGSGSRLVTLTDPLTGLSVTDLVGSVQINITGNARFFAGNGGNGFTTGGKGGSISGVVVRTINIDPNDPDSGTVGAVGGISASLVAGDGGSGVSGAGGAGGDVSQNSISGGGTFFAGDGATGRFGGNGGSVLGNGSSIFDAVAASITAAAGNGASGVRSGGHGGDVRGFRPVVGQPSIDASFSLAFTAGNGGDAVSGPGGRGGSIVNSSPREGDGIQAEIALAAGNGGDGLTGGHGGIISNFLSRPATNSKKPDVVSILGGNGGDGLSGAGGNGGSVAGITVPTRGGVGNITDYSFSRILGGNGGDSSGSRGGHGGSVSDITGTGASEGSFALVGGAGGDGLLVGGNGGGVSRANIFLPASSATKALIVGGEGGNAGAFVLNGNDSAPNQTQRAFGGRIGVGGNGGSIADITQSGNIGSHFDLIAGNGGDTTNYGSLRDTRAFVGKGGSIVRVKLTGDIGNLQVDDPNTTGNNENVPIKGYNNILLGETMADWVNTNLRAATAAFDLTDASGNVGIVVGTAGRNKAVVTDPTGAPNVYVPLPANGTVNGNLIDIEARNILSAVAGSVDRIANIQIAQNIRVLGGIIGGDKRDPLTGALGTREYLDPDGVPTANGGPVLDGRLFDGALIAKRVLTVNGTTVTLSGRQFSL